MRIIQQGEQKFGFEGKWVCNRCRCVWEMDHTDPKPQVYSDQRDGSGFHMPCPTCKTEVYRDVPRSNDYHR